MPFASYSPPAARPRLRRRRSPREEVGSVVKVACVCAQPSVFGPTSLNGYEYKITHYDYGEHERYIADLTAGDAPDLVLFRTTPL